MKTTVKESIEGFGGIEGWGGIDGGSKFISGDENG